MLKNDWAESVGLIASQTVGRLTLLTHCATSEVFPYPAGAATTVTPGRFVSNKENKCLRFIKLAGIVGAEIREASTSGVMPSNALMA